MKESNESFGGKPPATRVGKTMVMASAPRMAGGNDEGGRYVDRNLVPLRTAAQQNQFAPTPAEPVRMHHKLAGGC
jgi:hypothetical protein